MNRTLIKKLQNNDAHTIFADMTPDERQCLRDVGQDNREYLRGDLDVLLWTHTSLKEIYMATCYRIKADYQPKQEHDKCEIFKVGNTLKYQREYFCEQPISNVVNEADFAGFCTKNDKCVQLGDVATLHDAGHEVIALFRREKT